MPLTAPARIALLLIFATTGASVVAKNEHPARGVRFEGPVERVTAASLPKLSSSLTRLAAIDPAHPLGDGSTGQTLSLFGREDLIAASSRDYKASGCAPSKAASDVLTEIERRARKTSIVIINESHERSDHRGFTTKVATRLRPLGYEQLALETLSPSMPGTPAKYLPSFVRQPALPYFEDGDGHYLSEAGYGRLGRRAKTLGFHLLAYEFIDEHPAADATMEQRIATREEGQARNLAAFVHDHPGAKLLIHVGYSHATEVPRADGTRWMAVRLKEKTGIDPLTISQTTCRGGGGDVRLSTLPADEPPGTFDVVVDHPTARFIRGRPLWRQRAGDLPTSIPRGLYPASGWRVVEARPVGEPATSVPMDRVAIRAGEDVALMLPPGRYRLRIIDFAPN
ncbi:MAG TPA: hypothetical protein VNJ10_08185 [Sphingomonas sp.]|nr:hypothetical protein [Sphingomonas sp.]